MKSLKIYFPLVLILLILASCADEQEKTQPTIEDISESVYATGVVKSKNQYQVFPSVSGIIQQLLVSEGDLVKKGTPILIVDNDAARLNTENAQLAAEYAQLSTNTEKLNELQAAIDLARSKMQNDSVLLARQKNLWSEGVGTKVELEQRELSYQNAVTSYQSAMLRYKDLKKQLEFAARQSQKNLQISRSMASDYTIKSEVDGKVYSILRKSGEMISPQSPVAVIGDADEFIVELQVDEFDISSIRVGQEVLINMDSYKGQVFRGKIYKINPAMNERTRSFIVEAGFVTTPDALYPNLTTEANIILQAKKNAVTIPADYLLNDSLVIKEGGDTVKVRTGLKDYRKVEILAGLKKDDIILKPAQ